MNIMVGIVLYNPDVDRLKENINSIYYQTKRILLVDNNSENIDEIKKLVSLLNLEGIDMICNKENRGIAFALNQILNFSIENKCDWFLTLDQDSVCRNEIIKTYKKYIKNDVGQITCNIMERNIGLVDSDWQSSENVREVDFCISSGCLNNAAALKDCGGFCDELFIDGVDIDISCNLRKNNFRIIQVNYNGLLHELGESKEKNILGLKFKITNHKPWRNYYMRRNIIYVARKYYTGLSKYKMILKQILFGFGVILIEDKKIERLKNNIGGIIDGFKKNII